MTFFDYGIGRIATIVKLLGGFTFFVFGIHENVAVFADLESAQLCLIGTNDAGGERSVFNLWIKRRFCQIAVSKSKKRGMPWPRLHIGNVFEVADIVYLRKSYSEALKLFEFIFGGCFDQ